MEFLANAFLHVSGFILWAIGVILLIGLSLIALILGLITLISISVLIYSAFMLGFFIISDICESIWKAIKKLWKKIRR